MNFKLSLLGSLVLLGCATAQAAIVAEFANPPTVIIKPPAQGGVIVNINQADQNGVSVNSYSSFNVDPQGALLANNTSNTRSTQGFNIDANNRLTTGSAKVIVNEVFSQQASTLNGPIEVVGSRADVLVVNPSGISCNGCGFINTNNVTLTTARYLLGNNGAISFRVESEAPIQINGRGLNDFQSNNINLITKTLSVNGKVNVANNLNVITGLNSISSDLKDVRSLGDGRGSDIVIESGGGMYANNITIVTTKNTTGAIYNDGQIVSLADLTVNANGYISNNSTGKMASSYGNTRINLANDGALFNAGSIEAANDLTIVANRGFIYNYSTGSITQTGAMTGAINLSAERVTTLANSNIKSNGAINISSNNLTNEGRIAALQNLIITSRYSQDIDSRSYYSTITNNASGSLEGRVIKFLKFDILTNRGAIKASDAMALRGNTFINATGGDIFARNNFDIIANTRIDLSGVIRVGIAGVTPKSWVLQSNSCYYWWCTPGYSNYYRNFFYDANLLSRRFDLQGNEISQIGPITPPGRIRPTPPPSGIRPMPPTYIQSPRW